MYNRDRRAQSYQKAKLQQDYRELNAQLDLLDKFQKPSNEVRPTYDIQLTHQVSQASSFQKSTKSKERNLPKIVTQIEDTSDEMSQMQYAIDQQNIALKRLLKEQREITKTQAFKQELDQIKSQVQSISLRLPKLPQYEHLSEIKQEISSLRQSFFLQQQNHQQPIIQPPQIIYQQLPQPIQQPYYPQYQQYPYMPQQSQFPPQMQQYQPYQQYYQQPFQQQQQIIQPQPNEQQNKPQTTGSIKSKAASLGPNSKRSSHHTIQLVSRRPSKVGTNQSFFSNKTEVKYRGSRLKIIFNAVRYAMRWQIYCKPINKLWRKVQKHQMDCKAQIQKITYPVAQKRINDWCKMVLAKVDNYLQKTKSLDFINPEKPLNEQETDQSYMQLTNATKYLMSCLVTYCTSDFVIPELKLLCYLQFFDQQEIDRGLFVARRVLFWKEKQLDMTKTQQMMIVGDLVILVHILPSLLEIQGANFLVKCLVSLVQNHFMKFFDLRVLNRNPEYSIVYLNVKEVEGELQQELLKNTTFEDEHYITGLYDDLQFAGFYGKRPNFQEDMQRALLQIHTNLLQSLASK